MIIHMTEGELIKRITIKMKEIITCNNYDWKLEDLAKAAVNVVCPQYEALRQNTESMKQTNWALIKKIQELKNEIDFLRSK